jgi:hypothetical protein
MTNPIVKIHDLATGEEIEREMNADEFKQWEIDKTNAAAVDAELQAKTHAKEAAQAKLEALGLTTDDLKALGL